MTSVSWQPAIEDNLVWKYGPEGAAAYVPTETNCIAALTITEERACLPKMYQSGEKKGAVLHLLFGRRSRSRIKAILDGLRFEPCVK